MSRTFNKYAIFLALLMVVELSSCALTRRRRDDDNGDSAGGLSGFIDKVQKFLRSIPLIGGPTADVIQKLIDAFNKGQDLTGGALGRLLGGAFPCTFTLETIMCEGVSSKSDISKLVESVLDLIPGLIMPGFVKSLVMMSLDAGIEPLIDILLGGVPKS